MVSIREATSQDIPRALEIWRQAVDTTHDFLTPSDRDSIAAEVAALLPTVPLQLAVGPDDVAVGFMILDGSHIEALFVDPNSRGQGVGKTLIAHALSSHSTLLVDVNERNTQAFGFYKHLGCEPVGRSEVDGQGRPYPIIHMRLAAINGSESLAAQA
jgi:putative acetyltransferase